MNDYSKLANKLMWYAESDRSNIHAESMRQAADAIRVQAARIADLEREIERQLRTISELDTEVATLKTQNAIADVRNLDLCDKIDRMQKRLDKLIGD